jgi:hypothetical protein
VIVLSNNAAADTGRVAAALAGTLFSEKVNPPGEMNAVPISSAAIDRYDSTYQVGPLLITFTNENGHLIVAPKGNQKSKPWPHRKHSFSSIVSAQFSRSFPARMARYRKSNSSSRAQPFPASERIERHSSSAAPTPRA